jgi:small-conductance mechanosensitive channel
MFGQATIAIAALTLVLALILTYIWNVPPNEPTNGRLDMAKGSERNSKHVQPKTKEQAEEAYEKIKQELEQWKSKPNKTPEDKDYIKKLRKKLEQLRKKKDFSGENHSQKHKGH